MCFGYRLFTSSGSIAFFPDNEPQYGHRVPSPAASQSSAESGSPTPSEYARKEDQKLSEFLHGADVLIIDSQYDCDEYKEHIGWGHGCLDDVVALALQAQVKRLFLFHHDPNHDDAKIESMTSHARKLAAQKGSSLEI